ncbi:coiled-coil domain-containing protein 17 [Elysia marginata]|uniref:Coiled-coil domain-containing protein 17 n=1 Tax=Elysia marginata TaxID=1093978 RepID=A0AAV4EBN5_9GAST|nr:coiled-coil domain-containing protein 17 [Elysia marginata]
MSTSVNIDSQIYNPVYDYRAEFRETAIAPSATLLFKVYTIDNFYRQLTVVGYAVLNIFVETGTERQPQVDKAGLQISLNEGAHQLRLFSQGPNGSDPFSERCLRDANVRIIPCASLLVRLTKVPRGPRGKPLESAKVPKADWARLGLWYPRPKYEDRVYLSGQCLPTKGESRLFHAMLTRAKTTVREAVAATTKAKESFLNSEKNMEQYIRNQLTKSMDSQPLDQDLNFIAQYSPRSGIKLALDSAVNLPWANFTHAHICLNPPGAFYMGTPHATYDKLVFTEDLDIQSTQTSPSWKDGFKHFPRRSYHRFLVAVIHLQEVFVNVSRDNYKYGLLEQAWTAVQVFKDQYCYTETFQLPLFQGAPTQEMLKQLAREPCKDWMERSIRAKNIKLLDGASVFVRLCDARRDDELLYDVPSSKLVQVNVDYIPRGLEDIYTRERGGRPLETLIPSGKQSEQFMDGLKTKFKSLVYKLYQEGNMSND